MGINKFEGETLPFTKHGWRRQIRSGTFRNGGTYKHVEKVKVLGRGTMGAKLEEVHILASWDIDQGGNKIVNKRKGQHLISLKKGAHELAFGIQTKKWWWIVTYDCSYFGIAETQQEVQEILAATNWRKWMKKGDKKRDES